MKRADHLYTSLYVHRRRLMSLNARENAERINQLGLEMKALLDQGGVSQKAIDLAPHLPWR